MSICDNCGEDRPDVKIRPQGGDASMCDACWRGALEHGHMHGLHDDADDPDLPVDDCPLCPKRRP